MSIGEKFGNLNPFAFVIVDQAVCFHKPSLSSAARIIPPFGSRVEILQQDQRWVLLKWSGKEAWSVREHLANVATSPEENIIDLPHLNRAAGYGLGGSSLHGSGYVEIGPRGGRFTRTKNGFRRYF